MPDRTDERLVRRAESDALIMEESFRAILSSHQRSGRWVPADEIEVRAILGDVTLDFTQAELPPDGTIDIDAQAILGNIEIIVPDGAEVELDGSPFVGSIEQKARVKKTRDAIREWVTGERDADREVRGSSEPPVFRIEARAIFGNVVVTGR